MGETTGGHRTETYITLIPLGTPANVCVCSQVGSTLLIVANELVFENHNNPSYLIRSETCSRRKVCRSYWQLRHCFRIGRKVNESSARCSAYNSIHSIDRHINILGFKTTTKNNLINHFAALIELIFFLIII